MKNTINERLTLEEVVKLSKETRLIFPCNNGRCTVAIRPRLGKEKK